MNVQLAVLPVRERGSRLHRLMAGVREHECLVDNQSGFLEPSFDVAVFPLIGVLAERKTFITGSGKILFGPLELLDSRSGRGGCPGRGAYPDVCVAARVPAVGSQ